MENSVLYCGRIADVKRDERGVPTRLYLESDDKGGYVMLLTEDTVCVDSGGKCAGELSDLAVGEVLYVFHSPVATRSLPPQSVAFALVRNVPQDIGCGHYQVVKKVSAKEDGALRILNGEGDLFISAGKDTVLCPYGENAFSLADIQPGDRLIAWYEMVALSFPGQTYAHHLMLLPAKAK